MILFEYVLNCGLTKNLSRRDAYFDGLWKQALAECEKTLGPRDFQSLTLITTPADLLTSLKDNAEKYGDRHLMSFLIQIEPCLNRLREFTTMMAIVIRGPTLYTAIIWGMVNLMIQV